MSFYPLDHQNRLKIDFLSQIFSFQKIGRIYRSLPIAASQWYLGEGGKLKI